MTHPAPEGNLSWYILQGYRSNTFHVVTRKMICDEHDCIVERDALCIRANTLLRFFHTVTPYHTLTKTDMGRQLIEEGVLSRGREQRSARKKVCGHRYLELSFSSLQEASRKY